MPGRDCIKWVFWLLVAALTVFGIVRLEVERSTVSHRLLETQDGTVTLYEQRGQPQGPLVVVTHGFAGSRQMMQYISRDLARAGFTVAAFDFIGHGRSDRLLSPDVTRIEGTTMQLVAQTRRIVDAVRSAEGLTGDIALVGHSMATDIIMRAAKEMPEVAAVVAISMYSNLVSATFPERLLILSGEWEARLRAVARAAVAQVGGEGVEGETVANGPVQRRTIFVPNTEHVAVLFHPLTMIETRRWVQSALGLPDTGATWAQGAAILAVLAGLVVLSRPVFRLLPDRAECPAGLPLGAFLAVLLAPVLPAIAAVSLAGGTLLGLASFGHLLAFLLVWGTVSLAVLAIFGRRVRAPDAPGVLLLLVWALAVFAVALDRYAAAFLPVGPRLGLMAVLALGAVPFMLADRLLVAGARLWQRLVARVLPVSVLTGGMIALPQDLGLLFTVLPVFVLFYLVYGTMGRAVAIRSGPETAGVALGIILAWSIAASTPLFAG
jgi:pimeloyl-ACP methyl ester carboxylesterase